MCAGQGLQLHAHAVGQAHALAGISRPGVEQQAGAELHASGSFWSKELVDIGSPQAGPKVAAILSVADPLLGEFPIDERFTLELLELLFPPAMRQRLPNGGWRRVSLRILMALLRCRAVVLAEEEQGTIGQP